jgi:hypothetical protein
VSIDIHGGGYLFSALYRFFRFSYYGEGIYITPEDVTIPKEFTQLFMALPLDLQHNIIDIIWNRERGSRRVIFDRNTLVLPLSLKFLFSVYERLKHIITSEVVPLVDGTW